MLLACHCKSGISKDKQRSSSAKNSGKLKMTLTGGAAQARPMTGSNSSKPTPAPQRCQLWVLARAAGSLRAPARRHGKHTFDITNAKITEPLRDNPKSRETEPLCELSSYKVICLLHAPCLTRYCIRIRTRGLPHVCLQYVFCLAATSKDQSYVASLCTMQQCMFYLQTTSNGMRILSLETLEHKRNHMREDRATDQLTTMPEMCKVPRT